METIAHLGHLGDGLTASGLAVPGALPGETVSPEPPHSRLSDSPERQAAPCRHFGSCGGCTLQHASDALVASWKADLVRQALAAHGVRGEARTVFTAPPGSRRRAVFSGRRTKKTVEIGFHMRRSDRIVGVGDCRVIRPALRAALPLLGELTRVLASRSSVLRLTVTELRGGLDVAITGAKPLDSRMRERVAPLVAEAGLVRLSVDGERLYRDGAAEIPFGPARVTPPPGAFLQAVEAAEVVIAEAVLAHIVGATHVLDLYAGCGAFALRAAAFAEVHAVEAEAAMLDALDAGWRGASGLRRVTTDVRNLARRPLVAAELARFDAVIIDPPRAGARTQCEALAAAGPTRIAAVSCNPQTFARDAAILVGAGYTMGPVAVIDQFRWSHHVELVAGFTR
ncbi:MAG: RsmD family RNA methyltransferase [Pseudomonadota bacterium]